MLSRTMEEVVEGVSELVMKLNDEPPSSIIVVEGIKDQEALVNIGVEIRSIHLNIGMSMLSFLENLERGDRPFQEIGTIGKVIILTDWDRTGGRLASKLKDACRNLEIEFDLEYRRELSNLTRKWIRDIESLDSLIE